MAHEADSRLEDPLVLDEIELYGELVIAASASDEPLSQAEIDRVLGLRRERRVPVGLSRLLTTVRPPDCGDRPEPA